MRSKTRTKRHLRLWELVVKKMTQRAKSCDERRRKRRLCVNSSKLDRWRKERSTALRDGKGDDCVTLRAG